MHIKQAMLAVLGAAEKPGKDAREALTGIHLLAADTPDGYKVIAEATDGKIILRAVQEADFVDEELDVNLTRDGVEAAMRVRAKAPEVEDVDPFLEVTVRVPKKGTRAVTFASPFPGGDAVVTHEKEVKFPEVDALLAPYRPGEVLIGMRVEVMKKLVNAVARLGVRDVLLGIVPSNPSAPIYVQGEVVASGLEVIGMMMPMRLDQSVAAGKRDRRAALEILRESTEEVPAGITVPESDVEQMDLADEAARQEAMAVPTPAEGPEETPEEEPAEPEKPKKGKKGGKKKAVEVNVLDHSETSELYKDAEDLLRSAFGSVAEWFLPVTAGGLSSDQFTEALAAAPVLARGPAPGLDRAMDAACSLIACGYLVGQPKDDDGRVLQSTAASVLHELLSRAQEGDEAARTWLADNSLQMWEGLHPADFLTFAAPDAMVLLFGKTQPADSVNDRDLSLAHRAWAWWDRNLCPEARAWVLAVELGKRGIVTAGAAEQNKGDEDDASSNG